MRQSPCLSGHFFYILIFHKGAGRNPFMGFKNPAEIKSVGKSHHFCHIFKKDIRITLHKIFCHIQTKFSNILAEMCIRDRSMPIFCSVFSSFFMFFLLIAIERVFPLLYFYHSCCYFCQRMSGNFDYVNFRFIGFRGDFCKKCTLPIFPTIWCQKISDFVERFLSLIFPKRRNFASFL